MYRILIIIVIVFSGCFPGNITFTTSQGVNVMGREVPEVTQDVMENVLEYYATEMPKLTDEFNEDDIRSMMDNLVIKWEIQPEDSHIAGLSYEGFIIIFYTHENISQTALFHELTHNVLESTTTFGNTDRYHKLKPELWKAVRKLKENY